MTIFTVRLQADEAITRHDIYKIYGEIAEAFESIDLQLLEITDDDLAARSTEPVIPAKPRKPRGKNKPKGEPVSAVVAEVNAGFEKAFSAAEMPPIPASLKRMAE